MNKTTIPLPRPQGAGTITYRCAACQQFIIPPAEPVLTHIAGRLLAFHKHEVPDRGR